MIGSHVLSPHLDHNPTMSDEKEIHVRREYHRKMAHWWSVTTDVLWKGSVCGAAMVVPMIQTTSRELVAGKPLSFPRFARYPAVSALIPPMLVLAYVESWDTWRLEQYHRERS
jgi:hypothetical protein